jgi:AbrB family looped-hinge helix DNA binding protein
MEATVAERGQITLPKSVREALGLTKGTKLTIEVDNGRIVLRKDFRAALASVRGRFRLPPGKSTDDVMRELRGRAPGDPYPAPEPEPEATPTRTAAPAPAPAPAAAKPSARRARRA